MPSVSAYIAFVLREVLSSSSKAVSSEKEFENIQEKLKSLGY
jgi:hypothetical protein